MAKSNTISSRRAAVSRGKQTDVKFNADTLKKLADDLQSGRIPLDRITISDEMQVGLRAYIRPSGQIAFHVQYPRPDGKSRFDRNVMKIGDFPEMTIPEARELAKTIMSLAKMGIDVQEGLHERLITELKAKGPKWRP